MAIPFAYDGSDLPDSVRKAAQGLLQYQQAVGNKLPLAVEGSGLPDGVRQAAQSALEKGAAPLPQSAPAAAQAAPAGNPWMEGQRAIPEGVGKGILGGAGKVLGAAGRALGPAAGAYTLATDLNDKYGYGAYQNVKNMMEEARTRQAMAADPELAQRGQSTVDRITANAMQGYQGMQPEPEATGLSQEELDAQNPNEAQPQPDQAPQQSPMEPQAAAPQEVPPQVQAAQGAQAADQKAQAAQQEESQRQTLEAGATQGLATGAVSRPQMAEAVVKADMQQKGIEATPDAVKAAVATELTQMRTMGNSDLARYVSYAIMGAGLIGSFLDKSGNTGRAFAEGYNKQLDRNLTYQQMQAKAVSEQADRAIKIADVNNKITGTTAKIRQDDRGLDQGDTKIGLEGEKVTGLLGKYKSDAAIGAANVNAKIRGQDLSASTTIRGQDLANETARLGQGINAENNKRTNQTSSENTQLNAAVKLKTAATAADSRIKAAQNKAGSGVTLTNKDTHGIIDQIDGTPAVGNAKASTAAKAALSVTLANAIKNDPKVNVQGIIQEFYGKLDDRKTGGILGLGQKNRDLPATK